MANFCFLTQKSNLVIGKRWPHEYLADVAAQHPGALESQWIPTNPNLWGIERYPDFLAERRRLLTDAANLFLTDLYHGGTDAEEPLEKVAVASGDFDETDLVVRRLLDELEEAGYAPARVDAEVPSVDGEGPLALVDAHWPDGLQTGQGAPVVLALDHDGDELARMEGSGLRVFTSVEALRGFTRLREAQQAAGAMD